MRHLSLRRKQILTHIRRLKVTIARQTCGKTLRFLGLSELPQRGFLLLGVVGAEYLVDERLETGAIGVQDFLLDP